MKPREAVFAEGVVRGLPAIDRSLARMQQLRRQFGPRHSSTTPRIHANTRITPVRDAATRPAFYCATSRHFTGRS